MMDFELTLADGAPSRALVQEVIPLDRVEGKGIFDRGNNMCRVWRLEECSEFRETAEYPFDWG